MAQNNEFYINKTLNNEAIFHWFNIKSLNPKNPSAYVENELFNEGMARLCLKMSKINSGNSAGQHKRRLSSFSLVVVIIALPYIMGLKIPAEHC